MGKFNKTGKREMPALNTSSLPDLIFNLLFFFMIVTTMREVTLKVQFTLPQGTELEKLEKKSLVTFIYVGEPTQEYRAKMGTESRIQLNDSYAEVGEVQDFIFQERASMNEGDAAKMTVSLKVDQKFGELATFRINTTKRPRLELILTEARNNNEYTYITFAGIIVIISLSLQVHHFLFKSFLVSYRLITHLAAIIINRCQRIPQEMGNPITISHSQTDQSKYTQFRSQQLARFWIYSSFLYQ